MKGPELYDALVAAGVNDVLARKAAAAVLSEEDRAQLVTKADLRAELAELKAELIKWNVGTLIALAAIVSAIVKLLP